MSKAQLKKSQTTLTSQPAAKHPLSPTLEDLYPNLFSYLTQDAWEDGSTRVTSTILFFVERGELKCCISDRDAQRSAFLTGSDFQALLEAVEHGLEEDALDWRQKRLAR